MHTGRIQRIEIIFRLRRVKRGTDGIHAGVRDRARGQASVRVGVIGAEDALVRVGQDLLALGKRILDGRVDLQAGIELAAQAVIDDGGDRCALGRSGRLLFDEGCDRDEVVERKLGVRDLRFGERILPHTLGKAVVQRVQRVIEVAGEFVVEVAQEFVNDVLRVVSHIELVGIREEIALQPVLAAVGDLLQERIVEFIGRRGVRQILIRADAVFLQQTEDILALVAFGDGDLHDRAVGAGLDHIADKRMIVIAAVERIRTRLNGALGVGGPAVQLEKRFRTDKATVPQFLCDLRDRRAVCNGDGHLCVRLGQGQHIVRAAPRKHGKQHRRGQHAAHIQQHPDAGRQPSVLFFLRRFRLLRLLVDGQIRVFLRDLRLEQRRHIGRLLLRLRLLLQLGLGLRFGLLCLILVVHHRVDARKIVLDGRKQLVERKRFQTFFQPAVFRRLPVRTLIRGQICHVFLPYTR